MGIIICKDGLNTSTLIEHIKENRNWKSTDKFTSFYREITERCKERRLNVRIFNTTKREFEGSHDLFLGTLGI